MFSRYRRMQTQVDVVNMVLLQGGRLVAGVLVVGVALSLAGARLMQSMFFEVGAFDGRAFGLVTLGVAVASVIAMLVPALRASPVSPMVAIRAEEGADRRSGGRTCESRGVGRTIGLPAN